jgi:subtilisin family serine protease
MKKLFAAVMLLSVTLSSCVKENIDSRTDDINDKAVVESLEEKFVPGVIRIKVTESLASKIELSRNDEGEVEKIDVKSVEDIINSGRVSSIKRTFPDAGRFEARTRKAGLHLWYDVVFDDEVPLTKVHDGFSAVDGVEELEYQRRIVRYDTNPIEVLQSLDGLSLNGTEDPEAELPFDDPRLEDQWHYHNQGGTSVFLTGADVNVFPVWRTYTAGSSEVIVSVVDGGIDYEHEDLASNMWINVAELNGNRSYDDDSNGYRDDVYGYNFVTGSGTISAHSHGTHVAGTISAVNNNGKGVAGLAGGDYKNGVKGVRLMSCQIFSSLPEDEDLNANTAAAIKYGADNGAVISQNSWGYEEVIPLPSSIKAAIDYFVEYAGTGENGEQTGPMKGGIVIFAAGNENREESTPPSYEKVLSVASLGPDFLRATYSNYGDWVDISAPGGQAGKATVLSTVPDNGYGYMQGTSMACPHVSGVAALVISHLGGSGFSNDMLWDRLVQNTTDIYTYNRGFRDKLGSGMVNALGAIASSGVIPPQPVTEVWGESSSNNVMLKWLVTPDVDDEKAYGYTVYYSENDLSDLEVTSLPEGVFTYTVETAEIAVGDTIYATIPDLKFETVYNITVDAYDYSSNRSELSPIVAVTTEDNKLPVINALDGVSMVQKAFETKYLNFSFSDPDGHDITWELTPGSDAATASIVNDNIQVKIVGRDAEAGIYTGRITVTDSYGAVSDVEFSYEIEENRPPSVSDAPSDIYIGAVGERVILDLESIFNDPDGEQLSFNVSSTVASVAHINPNIDELFITSLAYGLTEVSVEAVDALGMTAEVSFKVLVRDDSNEVDLYPNPVKDILNLRMGEEVTADISLISSSGAEVFNSTMAVSPFTPAKVDMTSMSGGVYTVIIRYNGNEIQRNITKL